MSQVLAALQRLWDGRPTCDHWTARWPDLQIIQQACDLVSKEDWLAYVASWPDPAQRQQHESRFEAFAAIGAMSLRLLDDVRRTSIGLHLWHAYNMGFILCSPDACVGIDLLFPEAEKLVDRLDALLITHAHNDHVHPALIEAMLRAGKPVVSSFVDGPHRVKIEPWSGELVPGIRLTIDVGDHHHAWPEPCLNDMLMFHLDAGSHGAVYHTGDNSNAARLPEGRRCDAWMFHVRVGLDVPIALQKIKPKFSIGAHVLELGHPIDRFRWPYICSYERLSTYPPTQSIVPVWGERYHLPLPSREGRGEGQSG